MLDLDGLLALVAIGLLVFCLIDCIQTPADEIRGGIGKGFWLILIILLQIVGPIAWLVAGRPTRTSSRTDWRMGSGFAENQRARANRAPRGPDDDEEFLREMKHVNSEQEDTLKRWEEDLRRREAEQRRIENDDPPPPQA